MKTPLTIFTLVFTVMFPSISFAGWTKMGEVEGEGDTYYVDFDRIQKHDGLVYYWELEDLLKPDKHGVLSSKSYYQVDCKLFRVKYLSFSSYKEQMGGGTAKDFTPPDKWIYPSPKSISEIILKEVCSR